MQCVSQTRNRAPITTSQRESEPGGEGRDPREQAWLVVEERQSNITFRHPISTYNPH
jgi:hypothetical protein